MGLDGQALNARLELARAAAREAGQLTLQFFRSDQFVVERKSDDSPVTIADREAELLLRKKIESAFPNDGIVGEEFGQREGDSGFRWILDPIDGTTSFVSGVPFFGTLVGVEYQQRSIVGVICVPALDELVYAAEGCGAWYVHGNQPPRAARVSSCESLQTVCCAPHRSTCSTAAKPVMSFENCSTTPGLRELGETATVTCSWPPAVRPS